MSITGGTPTFIYEYNFSLRKFCISHSNSVSPLKALTIIIFVPFCGKLSFSSSSHTQRSCFASVPPELSAVSKKVYVKALSFGVLTSSHSGSLELDPPIIGIHSSSAKESFIVPLHVQLLPSTILYALRPFLPEVVSVGFCPSAENIMSSSNTVIFLPKLMLKLKASTGSHTICIGFFLISYFI